MKKKIYVTITLIITLAIMLSACGNNKRTTTISDKIEETPVVETENVIEDETSDGSESENIDEDTTVDDEEIVDDDDPETDADGYYINVYEYNINHGLTHREALLDICLLFSILKADVELDEDLCVVDPSVDPANGNPYDITWTYGKDDREYQRYVAKADWNMVFDASYYKKAFPMLAILYHNNDALLLKHFQTVGIHEGRQGNANFNVKAFMSIVNDDVRNTIGDKPAGYYFWYMLGEDNYDNIDLSGKNQPKQLTNILTALQKNELQQINDLRTGVKKDSKFTDFAGDAEPLTFNGEVAALANYRAWTNSTKGWYGHDWNHVYTEKLYDLMAIINTSDLGENTVNSGVIANSKTAFRAYYNSESHHKAMIDNRNKTIGSSNTYLRISDEHLQESRNPSRYASCGKSVQFDLFIYERR